MAKPIFIIEVSKELPQDKRLSIKETAKAELGTEYFVVVFAREMAIEDIKYRILEPDA